MTVTPSLSTPATPGIPGTATGSEPTATSPETSGLFAQLMAALVPHPTPADPAPAQEDPTEDEAPDTPVVPTPPGVVATASNPAPLHAATPAAPPVHGRRATTLAAAPVADSTPPAEPPTSASPESAAPLTAAPTTSGPATDVHRHLPTPHTPPAITTSAPTAAPTALPAPGPTPGSGHQRSGPEPVVPEAAPVTGVSTSVAPAAVPATASTSQPTPAAQPAPLPVSRQVIPELTRMSTLGEGVHRLTMTLRPEALGEVRVTMTVRDGSLHVRLAAGTDAQHALVPDLTELHQVLKLGSGSDVRVVLRDLVPPAPTQQSTHTGTHTGSQTGGHPGTGQHPGHGAPTGGDPGTTAGSGHHSRREAGTPRDINATDGAVDGTSGSRSQAVRRVRPTGVDLTM